MRTAAGAQRAARQGRARGQEPQGGGSWCTPRAPAQLGGVTLPPCTLPLGTPVPFAEGRVSVRGAFRHATLLLTGATGFVGSVVLEHLLRVQPDVERVFVIIRAKRGVPGALLCPHHGACNGPSAGHPCSHVHLSERTTAGQLPVARLHGSTPLCQCSEGRPAANEGDGAGAPCVRWKGSTQVLAGRCSCVHMQMPLRCLHVHMQVMRGWMRC